MLDNFSVDEPINLELLYGDSFARGRDSEQRPLVGAVHRTAGRYLQVRDHLIFYHKFQIGKGDSQQRHRRFYALRPGHEIGGVRVMVLEIGMDDLIEDFQSSLIPSLLEVSLEYGPIRVTYSHGGE